MTANEMRRRADELFDLASQLQIEIALLDGDKRMAGRRALAAIQRASSELYNLAQWGNLT